MNPGETGGSKHGTEQTAGKKVSGTFSAPSMGGEKSGSAAGV